MLALTTGGVLIMERRFVKKPLAERMVPEAHAELRHVDIGGSDLTQGLVIGGSCSSRLLYMHNIELTGLDATREFTGGRGSGGSRGGGEGAGGLSTLLSAATPFGTKVRDPHYRTLCFH